MAVPKRKSSKQRSRTRRANWTRRLAPNLTPCPQCHELKASHQVCRNCGYYKGREVVSTDEA